jgi:hypothetical protein
VVGEVGINAGEMLLSKLDGDASVSLVTSPGAIGGVEAASACGEPTRALVAMTVRVEKAMHNARRTRVTILEWR